MINKSLRKEEKNIKMLETWGIVLILLFWTIMCVLTLHTNHVGIRIFMLILMFGGIAILENIRETEIHKLQDEIARIRNEES